MSTAVDTAFEAIVSTQGEADDPLHLVCAHCWPRSMMPAPVVGVCGTQTKGGPIIEDPSGQRHCAKCVAIGSLSPLPCGHP